MKIAVVALLLGFVVHENAYAVHNTDRCVETKFSENNGVDSLYFSTQSGLSILVEVDGAPHRYREFTVSLKINNKPNPFFDRLYALIMKSADLKQEIYLCSREVLTPEQMRDAVSPSQELSSITVKLSKLSKPPVQKVAICDLRHDYECATVDRGNLITLQR